MNKPNILNRGQWGETKAKDYLLTNGYSIVEQNYHSKFGEIDIIAQKDNIVCFVEVKTRKKYKHNLYGYPVEAVNYSKQQKLIKTAQDYLSINYSEILSYRFDIIEVVYYNSYIFTINHLKGAFEL